MTNDSRSAQEIEREIEHERAELTDTLDTLQDRFSVESVARQFTDQFREHGGDIGRSVSDAVKRNPMALALTGIGLAWMMFGDRNDPRNRDNRYPVVDRDRAVDRERDIHRPYSTPATQPRALGSQPGDASRRYSAGARSDRDVPTWARGADYQDSGHRDDDDGPGIVDKARGAAQSASKGVSGAASSVAGGAQSAGATVADGAKGAAGAVSSAAKSAADGVRNSATAASDRAAAMRERIAEGTESLSAEARDRVIAARERAIETWHSAGRYGQQGKDRAVDLFDEHPLIAGALAVAVGAAFGAALPRTRTEDAYMGAQSDSLFDEAERIYEEEKSKIGKVATAATDEAKKIAREAKSDADAKAPADTAAQAVADKAKSSVKRVADAAQSEADKQKLGDVKS